MEPASPKDAGLAARHPQRGMRILHGLGDHRPGRDVVELAGVGERVLGPHARDHFDGLAPLGLGGLRIHLEAVHLDERCGAAGSQVHAAVADDVQHGGALGDPHRVIVRAGQQGDGVADADALGALGNRAVQHLGRGTVGELPQEVVLHRPEVVEPHVVGQLNLGHDLLVPLGLDAGIVGLGVPGFRTSNRIS